MGGFGASPAVWRATHASASSRLASLERERNSSGGTGSGVPPSWLAAGGAAVFGAAGCLAAARGREPARAEAAASDESVGLVVAEPPRAASVTEGGGGLSFSILTPEYRRNVFFIYEKRLRVFSPPEKVFEYFSSVKSRQGTFMTSLDLLRAAVPVFQPVDSDHVRSGFLGGEHRDGEGGDDGSTSSNPRSEFFNLFDTDGDGLISFPEYIFFITLLSLPESRVTSTFQEFDLDGSGGLSRDEFIEMMKTMRRSTSRGRATGFRTGLKATNPDSLSSGLVHHLFGDPGKEHKLSLRQFESFLRRLHSEIDELEFRHYDLNDAGSISVQDFGYSVVAGANVGRMQYFIQRTSKLGTSALGKSGERVTKSQYMAFCRILKHEGTKFQAKIRQHVHDGGKLSKEVFLRLAKECGASLSEAQVDVVFFIFDVDGDGELSPEEILDVLCR